MNLSVYVYRLEWVSIVEFRKSLPIVTLEQSKSNRKRPLVLLMVHHRTNLEVLLQPEIRIFKLSF